MPDIESQIRTYSSWLAQQADASAAVGDAPPVAEPTPSEENHRRWPLRMSVAAAIVALVIGLAVVIDQRDPAPEAPVATVAPPADTMPGPTTPGTTPNTTEGSGEDSVESIVSLADGFDVPVVGQPVDIDGIIVLRGAPAPQMGADVLARILAEAETARETPIEPVDTLTAPPAESIEPADNQVVALGMIGDAMVWIFARPDPPVPAACFVPMIPDDATSWTAACGAFGRLGLSGPSGSWTS